MSIFVATVILVVIAAIATILSGQRSTELNPSQEAYSQLLQKSQNLDAADSNFREYLTRNDYSSGLVSNPGLLQAVVLEASARYSNFVIASQNNPQNPAYNQHEEVINQGSEIEALKRINLGASGKKAELKYVDPSSGSWVTIPIDSAELAASGLVKLNIISNSRRETRQRFNLVTIAQFPWGGIGKYARNKYGKYNIHHTGVGYRHLGHEELGKDVLPLCLFAHWLIHGGKMKAKVPWKPNIIQKTLHLWCSFPLIIKQLILFFTALLLVLCFFYINIIFISIVFFIAE